MINSLSIYDRLVAAGVHDQVAREHASIMEDLAETKLATKQDISILKGNIRAVQSDINTVESSLRQDMKNLETNLKRDMKELASTLRHEMGEMELRQRLYTGGMAVVTIGVLSAIKFFG